jgi:hypothetical protein
MFNARSAIMGSALLLLSLQGCAPNPTRIDPKPVPVANYGSMTCGELTTLHNTDLSSLRSNDAEQRATRRSDAWGVLLIGLPVGRMAGGNRADTIAELKGELIAINSSFAAHRCSGTLIGKAD